MLARAFPELRRSTPVTLRVKASGALSADALKKLRAGIPSIATLPTAEIAARLRSDLGLRVPNLAAGSTRQLMDELRATGLTADIESSGEV
jgi:hypothetical protein